ncbi:MAG: thioredoxin family protein [Nitriliruptoraceae bacterium]
MEAVIIRLVAVAAIVGIAVLVGRWWHAWSTQVRRDTSGRLTARDLAAVGLDLGQARTGAVLVGARTCAPCDQVKDVLGGLARTRGDFAWVYADAADHPELTGSLRILRVPTVLVVTRDGRIVGRSSGVPRVEALAEVLDAAA